MLAMLSGWVAHAVFPYTCFFLGYMSGAFERFLMTMRLVESVAPCTNSMFFCKRFAIPLCQAPLLSIVFAIALKHVHSQDQLS